MNDKCILVKVWKDVNNEVVEHTIRSISCSQKEIDEECYLEKPKMFAQVNSTRLGYIKLENREWILFLKFQWKIFKVFP